MRRTSNRPDVQGELGEELTTAVARRSAKVHAHFASNKRTVCSAEIAWRLRAKFNVDSDENCVTCERQVRRWMALGRLV